MGFEIFKSDKTSKYHFRLKARNGEIILQSESYASKANAKKGVASVQSHAPHNGNFDRRSSRNGKDYFVLKAVNGRILGRSEMYNSKAAMENGIKSVMKNASAKAVVKEMLN